MTALEAAPFPETVLPETVPPVPEPTPRPTDEGRPVTRGTLDGTPVAWRAAALAILAGGFLAGDRAARGGVARLTVGLAAGVVAAYVGPIARASRRPPIPPGGGPIDPAAEPLTVSIVVGARDEASVLPALIRDVAAQDHRDPGGVPRFELIVVDDRSLDGTGDAVRAAAAAAGIGDVTRIIRREGEHLADGKGAALTAAQPSLCRGDVVVVLDADARIGPGFVRTVAGYVAAGAPAVTARRMILEGGSSWLAGAQADEQTLDGEIQRGRWALGGCSEFRGNGIVVRRDLLERVGGWRAEALTEDLDLSSRIAAREGVRVAWALDAEVWEEPVRTWHGLWRQRLRWAEGAIGRLFEHGPAVMRSDRMSIGARLDFAAYAGQLLVPAFLLGAVGGGLRRGRPGPSLVLVGSYLAGGGVLAFDALRWDAAATGLPIGLGERTRRAARVACFSGLWLGAVPQALWRVAIRRGPVRYEKMDHGEDGRAGPAP
jgi:glycosyltransferase involved in cell wall biosynthesis